MLYERTGGETTLFRVLASVLLGLAGHALLRRVFRASGSFGATGHRGWQRTERCG